MGGLCNICLDPRNAGIIIENKGIPAIIKFGLSSPNENTVLSAITTLYYLATTYSQAKKGTISHNIVTAHSPLYVMLFVLQHQKFAPQLSWNACGSTVRARTPNYPTWPQYLYLH
jgi:hypothetical protein